MRRPARPRAAAPTATRIDQVVRGAGRARDELTLARGERRARLDDAIVRGARRGAQRGEHVGGEAARARTDFDDIAAAGFREELAEAAATQAAKSGDSSGAVT